MLGNLLQDSAGRICKVEQLSDDPDDLKIYAVVGPTTSGSITPIELTKEIIEKLGFDDKEYLTGYTGKEFRTESAIFDFVLTKPQKMFETQKHYAFELREHRFIYIKYLHELQNFYLSITFQDLDVSKIILQS